MGKWLAEFQENTLEMPINSTDNTDKSGLLLDLSVLSVHQQSVLPELMAIVSKACEGLSLSPNQLIRTMNAEKKKTIIKWEHREIRLKKLAIRLDAAINNGDVDLIADKAYVDSLPEW